MFFQGVYLSSDGQSQKNALLKRLYDQFLQILLAIFLQQNKLICHLQMTFLQSVYTPLGMAFSIIGLTLVIPAVFLFRQYFRFFDHVQLTYLYWVILAPLSLTFASQLDDSWGKFIQNFLTFCNSGQIVCEAGFLLSFTICLIGVIFLLFLIVTFQKCRKPDLNLRFQPVYSVFKGFFRWTYLPLTYYSLFYLIKDIKAGTSTNLLPSAVIVAFTSLFPAAQLIGYKVIQTENDQIWNKWFEFLSYMRHFSIALIFVLGKIVETQTTIAKYFVYAPLVAYAALHLWKGVYNFKIAERILWGLGEAIAIVIYSLYLFAPSDLKTYQLDLIGLALILVLDVVLIILRLVTWLKFGQVHPEKQNPEDQIQNDGNKHQRLNNEIKHDLNGDNDFKAKKKNKYDESDDLQNSRDSLVNSVRKGNQRRKR